MSHYCPRHPFRELSPTEDCPHCVIENIQRKPTGESQPRLRAVPISSGNPDDKEAAEYLRDLADRAERGELIAISVVCDDRLNREYERFGTWKDRWAMYAALEYAKADIDNSD